MNGIASTGTRAARRGVRWRAALALPAFVAACGASDPDPRDVAFRTLDQSLSSGVLARRQVVVNTPQEWQALWSQHAGTTPTSAAPPAVDFSSSQVVAVFMGTQPSACQRVTIRQVVDAPPVREVRFSERVPGPTELCAAIVVTPAHLAEVPRTSLPVVFVQVAGD